uniref:Uncharacterized protein n=1 Tax=Sinocyclocheilus rhinocerous TaxID=307959 RepID=A0A673FSI2_9TELE
MYLFNFSLTVHIHVALETFLLFYCLFLFLSCSYCNCAEQAARLKKIEEDEKRKKAEFRKKMEKEVSEFIQDSTLKKKKYDPMGKIERSIL